MGLKSRRTEEGVKLVRETVITSGDVRLQLTGNALQAVKIWKMIWIIATTRIGMLNAMVKAIVGLCSFIHLEASTLRSKHSVVLVVLIQSSQVKEIEGTPLGRRFPKSFAPAPEASTDSTKQQGQLHDSDQLLLNSRVNVIGSISNLLYNGKEPVFPTCFTVPKGLELDIRASEQ
ncbi:hypothetical protein C5167_043119 [Papaver somniferum]|uniref:Uncharacterized protein n=1 Tax=Papaver somniferum TaxID=3469 RepID=A0A4Y7L8N7_PAPSO|nr:hypothetical protein C5167_043119 [Papaver somniferum]